MKITRFSTRRCAAALLVALAACGDRAEPLAPGEPREPSAAASFLLLSSGSAIQCQGVTASGGSLQCGGGDGTVEVAVSNAGYNGSTFSFDLAVRNRIPQPIGTTDGTTVDVAGVRVFFASGPVITSGSGFVVVTSPDGSASFTAASQNYFQYNTVLDSGEVSSTRLWQLSMPPMVGSFAFTLAVSAPVQHPNGWVDVSPDTGFVLVGGTRTFAAVSRNALGAALSGTSFTWSASSSGFIECQGSTVGGGSVSCDPLVQTSGGVVTGLTPGTTAIGVSDGTRTGKATVHVCPSLAVGGVEDLSAVAAGDGLCLGGLGGGAEYTLVLANTAASGVPLTVRGTGIVPAFGPPTPARLPGAGGPRLSVAPRPLPDRSWETRLREGERRELSGRTASLRAAGRRSTGPAPRRAVVPGEPLPGDLMDLNVATADLCSTPDLRTGVVKVVGTHVIVMADTANPAGGLGTADYQAVADSFDTQVWPVISANFGVPEDVDANGRVILFYTRAVNEATPAGAAPRPGFFLKRDLFPTFSCPTSNVGEVIYMMAADPSGAVNGNARSVASVRQAAAITLAHEMQHLVNASRRLLVNSAPFEEVWLDEGLSAVAEELLFYRAAQLQPTQNLDVSQLGASTAVADAFFAYAEPSFARLRQWLLAPPASGFFQADDDNATRGAAWAYLRYVAHRKGGSQAALWSALVNSTATGLSNVSGAAGASGSGLAADFAVATYTDDAGLGAAAAWTQPAWNFRSVYGALDYDGDGFGDGYPLAARNPANGAADTFTLVGGGAAAYLRMGVAAGGFARVSVARGATTNPVPRLVVVRRK